MTIVFHFQDNLFSIRLGRNESEVSTGMTCTLVNASWNTDKASSMRPASGQGRPVPRGNLNVRCVGEAFHVPPTAEANPAASMVGDAEDRKAYGPPEYTLIKTSSLTTIFTAGAWRSMSTFSLSPTRSLAQAVVQFTGYPAALGICKINSREESCLSAAVRC